MVGNLPQNLPLQSMQTQWSQQLNPVLANTILQGNQVNNIVLIANVPMVINHLLARQMQGWFIVDQDAAAYIYRVSTQPFNSKTITLVSSANVTINLWCY